MNRIIFMGTPDFAVASLSKIVEGGFEVAAVVTAPDKPAGRGMNLAESAVKKFSKENGLPLLQPVKLKDPAFVESLRTLNADLFVVVAFRMLPEVVWNMPREGTINLHASLLPDYRGAAPINWAIINGEEMTGLTTFRLQHEIDTGDILKQLKIPIGQDTTAGDLYEEMKVTGASLLLDTLVDLQQGRITPIKQEELQQGTGNKHAPKITTETCRISWDNSVKDVYNLIRGLSPYPAAFTTLERKILKIFRAEKEETSPATEPGSYQTDGKSYLKFACNNGYIYAKELQLEGKKRMSVTEFLRGYHFN